MSCNKVLYFSDQSFVQTSIGNICLSDKIVIDAIEVFAKPTIVFSSNATFSCDTPFVVDFMDQTIDAISWNWDFGNGITSNLQNPSVLYDSIATYNTTLSVNNIYGCKYTYYNNISSHNPKKESK